RWGWHPARLPCARQGHCAPKVIYTEVLLKITKELGGRTMNVAQRWPIVVIFCILAVGLATYFLEYRTEDKKDHSFQLYGLILPLNEGLREPGPSDQPPPPAGYKIAIQGGIYTRRDYPIGVAVIGGVVIPFLFLVGAGYLVLRGSKISK